GVFKQLVVIGLGLQRQKRSCWLLVVWLALNSSFNRPRAVIGVVDLGAVKLTFYYAEVNRKTNARSYC
ncbi:hypothetical protein, partial [Microbulbifer epialgicus]